MAAMIAILQFSEGASSKHLAMEKAGVYGGEHSISGSTQKDKKRVDNAQFKSSKKQKCVRKKIRQGKKKAEEERNSAEGTTYSSGKLNDINPLTSSSSGRGSSKDD